MKSCLLAVVLIATTWGILPAQADVGRDNFKLSSTSSVLPDATKDFNDLIFLKARVKELELEVETLKKASRTPKVFGNAYVNDNGELKLKSLDGGPEWNWDGDNWSRPSFQSPTVLPAGGFPFGNGCINGRCPTR